jgi:hypothetical protein
VRKRWTETLYFHTSPLILCNKEQELLLGGENSAETKEETKSSGRQPRVGLDPLKR